MGRKGDSGADRRWSSHPAFGKLSPWVPSLNALLGLLFAAAGTSTVTPEGTEVRTSTVPGPLPSQGADGQVHLPAPVDDDWWIGHAMLGGTLNPRAAGLFVGLRRHYVYHRDERRLFDGLSVDVGTEWVLSASIRPGVFVEWLPIKILKLRLQYELWAWLGVHTGLGHGLVFAGADAPFDPDTLKARQGEERPGFGQRLTFIPTLQLKLWRVVAFSTAELAAWYVHGDGGYWLEPINDNLVRRGAVDGVFKNSAFLLFQIWQEGEATVLAGLHDEYVHSFSAGLSRHRLGLALSATPFATFLGLNRPTLLSLFGLNLADANRRRELFFAVGLRVELDLFKGDVAGP